MLVSTNRNCCQTGNDPGIPRGGCVSGGQRGCVTRAHQRLNICPSRLVLAMPSSAIEKKHLCSSFFFLTPANLRNSLITYICHHLCTVMPRDILTYALRWLPESGLQLQAGLLGLSMGIRPRSRWVKGIFQSKIDRQDTRRATFQLRRMAASSTFCRRAAHKKIGVNSCPDLIRLLGLPAHFSSSPFRLFLRNIHTWCSFI